MMSQEERYEKQLDASRNWFDIFHRHLRKYEINLFCNTPQADYSLEDLRNWFSVLVRHCENVEKILTETPNEDKHI
jgi:hypothetical protein